MSMKGVVDAVQADTGGLPNFKSHRRGLKRQSTRNGSTGRAVMPAAILVVGSFIWLSLHELLAP